MAKSRARQMADLLSGSTGTGTIAPALVSDQSNTSNGYFDLPSGTTAQRPSSPSIGQIRYNTTTGQAEQYMSDGWQGIAPPPVITNSTNIIVDTTNNPQTITITGQNFDAGADGYLVDANNVTYTPTTSTRVSSSQVVLTFAGTDRLSTSTAEPLRINVNNGSGLSASLDGLVYVNTPPVFSQGADTTISNVFESESMSSASILATDADSDTVTFSVTSGALPNGLTMDSSGVISGTPNVGDSYTSNGVQHNFTVTADDGSTTVSRQFNIIRKWKDGSTSALAVNSPNDLVTLGLASGQYYVNDGTRTRVYYVDTNGSEAGAAGFIRVDSSWVTTVSGAACINGGGTISSTGIMLANTDNGGGGSGAHGGCGVSVVSPFRARYLRITDKSFTGNANCGGVDFPNGRFQVFAASGSSHNGSFTDYNYPGWEWQGSTGTSLYQAQNTNVFTGLYDLGSDQDIVTHLGVGSYGSCTNRPCSMKLWFKW